MTRWILRCSFFVAFQCGVHLCLVCVYVCHTMRPSRESETHLNKYAHRLLFLNFPIMIKLGMRSIVTRPSSTINKPTSVYYIVKCTNQNDDEYEKRQPSENPYKYTTMNRRNGLLPILQLVVLLPLSPPPPPLPLSYYRNLCFRITRN